MNQVIEKIKNAKKVKVKFITQLGSNFPSFPHGELYLDEFE